MANKGADKRKEKRQARAKEKLKNQVGKDATEIFEAAKAGPPAVVDPQPQPEYRRVTILKDSMVPYPELWMTVFIADTTQEPMFAEMFTRASCYKADNLDQADLVVFTGGPDVNPELYGEEPHRLTNFNEVRDQKDMELYVQCLNKGIPMFGVCRGAQFLHVMNGGKLWQHVDGHTGEHSIRVFGGEETIDRVSSTHHQMVRPHNGMQVIAIARQCSEKWANPKMVQRMPSAEIEAFFYPDTCCLGIQGHPEYKGYGRFTQWALKQIEHWIQHNARVKNFGGVYRFSKDLVLAETKEKK